MTSKEKDIKNLEERMQKDLPLEEEWDTSRIVIGLIILATIVVGVFFAKNYLLGLLGLQPSKSVQGAQTVNLPGSLEITPPTIPHYSLPSSNDVQNKISQIQKQVSNINVAEIASSSPQIQSVIQQIESLPQVPGNVAKQQCLQICSKL